MLHKIEPKIIEKVNTLKSDKVVECIVYAQNYNRAKKYLDTHFTSDYAEYPFIKGFKLNLNAKNIFKIASLNVVKYITSSPKVSTLTNVSNKILNTENTATFSGDFTVAIIDTGVYPHIDFLMPNNKIVKFVDIINGRNKMYDDNGHGTFVASVLCGNGLVSGGKYRGIEPNCNVIVIKALDELGETSASTILRAMQWVYDNIRRYNIRVVNMSFGSLPLGKNDPLIVGAEVLWNNNIVVVGACGNSGPEAESIKSPGASTKIITVGALDDKRDATGKYDIGKFEVADFSSRGPIFNNFKPDLIAPGVDIKSACNFSKTKTFYCTMNGTSVATPMISAICCKIIKKSPNITPNQVKKILIDNCTSINGNRNVEGFGWFNGKIFTS